MLGSHLPKLRQRVSPCCDSGQPPHLFLSLGLLENEPISPVVACVMEKQRGVVGWQPHVGKADGVAALE